MEHHGRSPNSENLKNINHQTSIIKHQSSKRIPKESISSIFQRVPSIFCFQRQTPKIPTSQSVDTPNPLDFFVIVQMEEMGTQGRWCISYFQTNPKPSYGW